MRKLVASSMLAVMLFGLTACSKEDRDDQAEAKSSTSESKDDQEPSDGVDPERVSPSDLPKAPRVKGKRGDIKALTLSDCPTEAGVVKAQGTIKSSAKKTVDYLVSISWTTPTGDVMGRGDEVLRAVKPGSEVKFKLKADVAEGATQCVPGVLYGDVK